jgi:hypothetical protein
MHFKDPMNSGVGNEGGFVHVAKQIQIEEKDLDLDKDIEECNHEFEEGINNNGVKNFAVLKLYEELEEGYCKRIKYGAVSKILDDDILDSPNYNNEVNNEKKKQC